MTDFDMGFSHVALPVANIDRSIEFYQRFGRLEVVHRRRTDDGASIAWLSDLTRPFALVLIERGDGAGRGRLGGWSHLGLGCTSRDDVDRRLGEAASEGFNVIGPCDDADPVGYWGIVIDPDGHNVELSFGQRVGSVLRSLTEGRSNT